jgi:hypothetical protein
MKIFPQPTDHQKKLGWKYDFKFLEELNQKIYDSEDCISSSLEGIQETLILIEPIIKKHLERIAGLCGHPDSSQACRNILAVIKEIINED